jgi:hypothetical protein
MDLIIDLPPINDCDSILVVVDRGNTKGAIFIPMAKTLTQEGAGQLLLDNFYKQFGLPDEMLSDKRTKICCKSLPRIAETLGNQVKLDNGLSSTDRWCH